MVQIEDEEVPLAVIDDQDDLVRIEDEEVPLASGKIENQGRIWWSWIPVIGAIASAVEGARKKKDEDSKEDQEK